MNFFGVGLFLSIENFSLLLLKVEAKKFLIFVKTFLVLPDTKKNPDTTKKSQRFTYLENLISDQIGKIGKGVSSPIVLIFVCRRVPIFVYKTAGNEAISSGFDSTLI